MSKIDRQASKRITAYLRERVSDREGPRTVERSLHEPLAGLWRYRVGDFRVICDIQDGALRILVVQLGNRREVYR